MLLYLLLACNSKPTDSAEAKQQTEPNRYPLWDEPYSWMGELNDTNQTCLQTADLNVMMLRSKFGIDLGADAQFEDVLQTYTQLLLGPFWNMGTGPRVVLLNLFFMEVQYKDNRDTVLTALEDIINGLAGADQDQAWLHYGLILHHLGEYTKIIDTFGDSGAKPAGTSSDSALSYILAGAYWRLGQAETAHPFAVRAVQELDGAMVDVADSTYDAKRLLALVELSMYGQNFYDKASTDLLYVERAKDIFAEDESGVPFVPKANSLGIDLSQSPGNHSFVDFDGDGWDDLFYQSMIHPGKIFKNNNGEGFSEVVSLDDIPCGRIGMTADFTGDGEYDLYLHGAPFHTPVTPYLLQGDGNFNFSDISDDSGFRDTPNGPWVGMSPAVVDYDLDGDLDIGIANQAGASRLFRNKGDGQFEDVSELLHGEPNLDGAHPWQFGFCWGDIDNDGWPDAARSGHGWLRLAKNNGDGTFTDVTEASGLSDSTRWHRQCFFSDVDNDGDVDLWVGTVTNMMNASYTNFPLWTEEGWSSTGIANGTTIFLNDGQGNFTDTGSSTGFHPFNMMSGSQADWNNDGWIDIVGGPGGPRLGAVNPLLFYVNNQQGGFELKSPITNPHLWAKTHGMGWGDYNHDGSLDLIVNMSGITPADAFKAQLWENTGNDNNWLIVQLRADGENTNRHAVGARVTLTAGGVTQTRELWSGDALLNVRSKLHFGLGQAESIDRMVIRWPNAEHQETVLEDVPLNKAIIVNESGIVEEIY